MEARSDFDRRQFLKAAVATGGVAALSACLDITDEPVPTASTIPRRCPSASTPGTTAFEPTTTATWRFRATSRCCM